MTTLIDEAHAAFCETHQFLGSPTIAVIPPMHDWPIMVGYTYDLLLDAILDEQGTPVPQSSFPSLWITSDIPVVTEANNKMLIAMMAGGLVKTGSISITIWQDRIDQVEAAYGYIVNSMLYVLRSLDKQPVVSPRWASCILERK